MRSLRVAVICEAYPIEAPDPTQRFVHEQLLALKERGHRPVVVVPTPRVPPGATRVRADWASERDRPPRYELDGVEVVAPRYVKLPGYRAMGITASRGAAAVTRRIARIGVDVVHVHTPVLVGAAVRVGTRLRVPTVWTIHGEEDPRVLEVPRRLRTLRLAVSRVDRIVIVGEPLRSYAIRLGMDNSRIRIVPNGVRLEGIEGLSSSCSPPPGLLEIVSISGLRPEKGLDDNVRAVRVLADRGLNVSYRVYGEGSERDKLRTLARELGVEHLVTFEGWLSPEHRAQALGRCQVFSIPSRLESFGLAHAEAMLAGRVVIAGQGTGPEAFITDGETGFLVEAGRPDQIAERVEWVLMHADEAARIAERGRARITTDFTWQHSAAVLAEVYQEVIEEYRLLADERPRR